jgi:hypothetical protein
MSSLRNPSRAVESSENLRVRLLASRWEELLGWGDERRPRGDAQRLTWTELTSLVELLLAQAANGSDGPDEGDDGHGQRKDDEPSRFGGQASLARDHVGRQCHGGQQPEVVQAVDADGHREASEDRSSSAVTELRLRDEVP